jgi:hypothetical protein
MISLQIVVTNIFTYFQYDCVEQVVKIEVRGDSVVDVEQKLEQVALTGQFLLRDLGLHFLEDAQIQTCC